MKGTEFQRLIRAHLLPKVTGFKVSKYLLFAHPFDYLIRGYCFESTQYLHDEFRVYAWVQPLFVPSVGVNLTLARTFGNLKGKPTRWWKPTPENEAEVMEEVHDCIVREGGPFLDRLKTVRDYLDNAASCLSKPEHFGILEARMYAAVVLGEAQTAEKLFCRYERDLQCLAPLRDWEVSNLERVRLLRQTFLEDSQGAVSLLNRWRDETVKNIGLTKFTEPMSKDAF